jgi:hypothetical protein
MKKLLILGLMFGLTIKLNAQTKLYKGIYDGMNHKSAINEFKENKDDYSEVNLGNGFIYTINRMGGIVANEKNEVKTITMWPKGSALTPVGYQLTINYLNHSRSFFIKQGYSVMLENPNWNLPMRFNDAGYVYGLVLLSPEKDRVVHLFPTKQLVLGSTTEYTYNPYIILMTKNHWDYVQNKRTDNLTSQTSKTDF